MIFICFETGITPVSMTGTLVKAIVTLDTKGISGEVKILNRILPDTAVNSALISMAALIPVLNLIPIPGGAARLRLLVEIDATG
jgi:hypothetical protein